MKYSAIFLSCLNFAPKKGYYTYCTVCKLLYNSRLSLENHKVFSFFCKTPRRHLDILQFKRNCQHTFISSSDTFTPWPNRSLFCSGRRNPSYPTVYLRGHPFPAGPNAGVRPSQQQPWSEWVQSYRFGSPLVIFIFWSESATGWYWGIGYGLPGYWPTVSKRISSWVIQELKDKG